MQIKLSSLHDHFLVSGIYDIPIHQIPPCIDISTDQAVAGLRPYINDQKRYDTPLGNAPVGNAMTFFHLYDIELYEQRIPYQCCKSRPLETANADALNCFLKASRVLKS